MKTDILFAGGQQELSSLFLSEGANLLCDNCCEDIWSILSIGYTEVLEVYVNALVKQMLFVTHHFIDMLAYLLQFLCDCQKSWKCYKQMSLYGSNFTCDCRVPALVLT